MIIETGIKGLSVKIGTDGVWINISANTRKHASFNLVNYANDRGGITKRAILDWCGETMKKHNPPPDSDGEGRCSCGAVLNDIGLCSNSGSYHK